MYFVSADIGTQGTKTAIVDERGRIASSSFKPSKLQRLPGGAIEQDPEEMFRSLLEGIREAVETFGGARTEIAAIGIAGQMAGILGIDAEWNAVTPYDSWLDSRCESEMPAIKAWGEEAFIRITGCPVTYAHGPKKLWWKNRRPEAYARIRKFVVPSAYASGRLAGLRAEDAFIDHTHAHFAGFADVAKLEWSETLLSAFGMDGGRMPRIVRPWDVVGKLRRDYAEATGLPEGVPIVAGCGDTAAAAFGAGLTRGGRLLDIAGTASVLSVAVDAYRPDAETKTLIFARSVLPELWSPLAYINGGGECLAWFRRLVAAEREEDVTFDALNELARQAPPGSDGLLFVPHFNGRVCPNDTDLRGGWLGLNWAHDRGAMYRAILESIAYEYKHYLTILERLAGRIDYAFATVVGGGAKGALFNRIKADVLGVPLRALAGNDGALAGIAAIAGYGIGRYGDLAGTVESFLEYGTEYLPDPANRDVYAKQAGRYAVAVEGLSALYGKLN